MEAKETSGPANDSSDSGSLGSLCDGDIGAAAAAAAASGDGDGLDDDGELQSDTWIEELECALLADCDPATLKKISEGKKIPASLRPDYWRTLLALNDAGKVKLTGEYDLPNQDEIRQDCERLVEDISSNIASEPLTDAERLRLKSDFESTLTTYVKARPELEYVTQNGWTDILKVLYNLNLSDTQMYQMFFRIVDRYIPKDLSPAPTRSRKRVDEQDSRMSGGGELMGKGGSPKKVSQEISNVKKQTKVTGQTIPQQQQQQQDNRNQHRAQPTEKSIQAYHLLRLLIQYHDPELCSILDSRKVTPNLYVKDWFCSLFARSCSPSLALQIWDMHFKMADPFLIFFAAIVMVVNASDELKKSNMGQVDMLNVLRVMPSKLEEDDIEDLYYLVSNHYTNSTPRSIRSYSHLFFMDTFGNTYSGNESPEDSPSLVDLRTTRLTSSLDLSQYLCLPIVPAEIFAHETSTTRSQHQRSSPTSLVATQLRYFLVDCRPAEQYNAGHLTRAFHLDCSLMLREPSSFATAVQALLEIQRQLVASKANTGGQHLCFIGSGQEEEDQYVNMVVASFLQKYQKYVSIVFGGFDAIHDYVKNKSELRDSFDKYIVDHNEDYCKACCSKTPEGLERLRAHQRALASSTPPPSNQSNSGGGGGLSSSLFATTTSFFKGDGAKINSMINSTGAFSKLATNPQASAIAQSGASMFDRFANAFVSKSSVIKERLVETLNTTNLPTGSSSGTATTPSSAKGHVSSQDKLGPRYTGSNSSRKNSKDGVIDDLARRVSAARKNLDAAIDEEPCQEVQVDVWQRETKIIGLFKCAQIKGNSKYPGYIALTKTHLWILREIPHNKGFVSIAAKRPLDMVAQITSKRRQPDLIIFRYGYASKPTQTPPSTSPTPPSDGQEPPTQSVGQKDQQQQQQQQPAVVRAPPTIIASDHLQIPQAFEVIRLIKREVVRIKDENSSVCTNPATSSTSQPTTGEVQSASSTSTSNQTPASDCKPNDPDQGDQSNKSDHSKTPVDDKKEAVATREDETATTDTAVSTDTTDKSTTDDK